MSNTPNNLPPSNTPGGATPAELGLRVLGDFDLREVIGRGGMGTVYRAWQRSLQRVVALKLNPTFNRSAEIAAKGVKEPFRRSPEVSAQDPENPRSLRGEASVSSPQSRALRRYVSSPAGD